MYVLGDTPAGPVRPLSCQQFWYVAELVWPRFVVYRGIVIRDDAVARQSIDTMLDSQQQQPTKVAAIVNHLHLIDEVTEVSEAELPACVRLLTESAQRIAEAWRHSLRSQFPDRSFLVKIDVGDRAYGPTITFTETERIPGS
jgi:hypothetical protein